ncbi:MAG: KH domain-containing protein [Bacteroidota bacterium]|mgnify:CR=1 FL=1
MKEFVEYLAKQLVDYPDEVLVIENEQDGILVLTLKVGKNDMAKIIGRKGRNARAMRILITAYGKKMKRDVRFSVIDETQMNNNDEQSSQTDD